MDGCFEKGAHLVSIRSEDENRFVDNYVTNFLGGNPAWSGYIFSLGLTCPNGSCTWDDGSALTNYTNWHLRQTFPGRGKCVAFQYSVGVDKNLWQKQDCETERTQFRVCKRPAGECCQGSAYLLPSSNMY